jgi:hypothetical protein
MKVPRPSAARRLPPWLSGLWPLGLGLVLILLFFWKLAFTNLILARGDTFLYFYPYWAYRARALLAGQLPLWDPYLFMGAPFLANSQAGVLYPLNWPLVFFNAPAAVKISILLHLLIAASGAYLFARRSLGQSQLAAQLAASLFALGGYFTSQIEHVNQLQGLAWFPWLLLVVHGALTVPRAPGAWPLRRACPWRRYAAGLAWAAGILAMQLLAGHTQSTFISLTGAALYGVCLGGRGAAERQSAGGRPASLASRVLRQVGLPAIFLGAAFAAAAWLSAAQLLPTAELSQQSLRGGGLPLREALSFSLTPRLLGRALLPGYSRTLFSEFVVYWGVAGLALTALGVRRGRAPLSMLALAAVGLAFALGAYDPLYAALANVPPFNLFRVPARWLFLVAFGCAMLAGLGFDRLRTQELGSRTSARPDGGHARSQAWRPALLAAAFVILVVLLAPLANSLVPPGETGALGAPAWCDVLGWVLPLAALAVLWLAPLPTQWRAVGVWALAVGELFAAAQVLPYNHLTAPDAYSSIRPAMTQLMVDRGTPAGRFLSMSALRFDPGDLAELHSELDGQLPPDAVYDAIIAAKYKEVLSPNLPLAWNIPAVDGYDGGILPLRFYAEFSQLFTGQVSADGRLRENLTAAPDNRLLSLVNARYLTTDKVGDAWVEGVFYDLQFTLTLTAGQSSMVAYVPKFEATALGVVVPPGSSPSGRVQMMFSDGTSADWPLAAGRLRFDHPATPTAITLVGPLIVRGLSLIDERAPAFQSVALGPYRLVHSGDVKIYENLRVLPRAFVAPAAETALDDDAARARLADPTFDTAKEVLLAGALPQAAAATTPGTASATITAYSPEAVRLSAQGAGYLVLTDAFYPGWKAWIDGVPAPILRADLMFRAVYLPAGSHVVEFRFAPDSVSWGLWLSGIAWAAWLAALLALGVVKRRLKPHG